MSDDADLEETTRRPAHLIVVQVVLIAPIGGVLSNLADLACQAAKRQQIQWEYLWAGGVITAVLLGCYLLVEELARGRARWQALAMFVTFAFVHSLLLDPVFGALWQHVLGWTPRRGGDWPLLDVWSAVVEQLKQHWANSPLVPLFLTGVPLTALGVGRVVLRIPGWAQLLLVVAAAITGGAIVGLWLSIAAGYPREAWGMVIASAAAMSVPGWAAIPFGLRIGDRVAPWVVARVAERLTRDRSSA